MFINKIESCLSAIISMSSETVSCGEVTQIQSLGNRYNIIGNYGIICVKKEDYVGIVVGNRDIRLYFKSFPPISISIDLDSEKGKKSMDFIKKEFIEHNEKEIDLLNT